MHEGTGLGRDSLLRRLGYLGIVWRFHLSNADEARGLRLEPAAQH